MLLISDETLDLIAGGYTASGDASRGSIPSVTITDHPPSEGSVDFGGWDWGGGEGSGGAPHPDPAPPHHCPPVHSSPVPAHVPKDVDMNTLRNTMLDVATQIKTMDSDIEHGAIVVRAADGALRVGEIAHGDAHHVDMAVRLHDGDMIVGYIHSHPMDDLNQTLPSVEDFSTAAKLREQGYTDKGMMLYILDDKSGDVFEYHADTAINTRKSGPNITDDISNPCG